MHVKYHPENMVRKILDHPVVPIVVGAGVAIDGPGNISIRSAFLAFCGLWLCYDVFIRLREKQWRFHWKSIVFSLVFCTTFVCVMLLMQWLLTVKLEEFQQDAFMHLDGHLYAGSNPIDSVFTFTNGGKTDMMEHKVLCGVKAVDYQGNKILVADQRFTIIQDSQVPLRHGGGDGQSVACLNKLAGDEHELTCADLVFRYQYVIDTDPTAWKEKSFRFAAHRDAGRLEWHQELVDKPTSTCDVPMPDISRYRKVSVCPEGCTYSNLQKAVDEVACGTVVYLDSHKHPVPWGLQLHTTCDPQHWIIVDGTGIPPELLTPGRLN